MRRGYIIWIADKGRELHLLRLGESEGKIFQFPRAKFFLTSPTASSCRRTSPDWHIFFFLETSCTICFASILVINLQFLLPFLQFWWIYRPACPTVLFNSNLFVELWYTVTDLLQKLLTKFRFERARFIRKFTYVVWTNVRVYEVFSWFEKIDDLLFNPNCSNNSRIVPNFKEKEGKIVEHSSKKIIES